MHRADPSVIPQARETGRAWRNVYLAALAAPLLAHVPELVGWVSCNPIYRYAGLVEVVPRHLLRGSCSIDGNDGTTLQALGGAAAESWLHGVLPWWDSYAGLGLPLAAETQPAAFFLPFVLLLHFFAGLAILKIIMQMLAGAFAVALFRELGVVRSAAAVGGIFVALNGSFAWYAHSPILPIAFLPALLFGLERCRHRAELRQPGGPVWVAVALAYSLLAGFPETAFMDGLLAAVWAVVAMARTPADRRAPLAGKILCGGLAGMALSAPAWVSFVDYLGIASVGIHALVPESYLPAGQAATLLLPGLYGPPLADIELWAWGTDGGYFGPALALLALAGLLAGRHLAGVRWAMAAWIIFWLCVFFRVPGAHGLWASYKPLNEVGVTRYAMPSLECAAAVLAALAVDDWCRARPRVRAVWAAVVFAALAAAALAMAAHVGRPAFNTRAAWVYFGAALLEGGAVIACVTWLLGGQPRWRRQMALCVLVAMDATAQFVLPELAGTRANRLALTPVAFLRAQAGLARVYALNERLPENYGSWFGVAQIQVDSLPFPNAWADAAADMGGNVNWEVTGWLQTPATQLAAFRAAAGRLRAAGVRYVVVSAENDPFLTRPEPGMTSVFEGSGTRIYDMPAAAPYFEARGSACELTVLSREEVQTNCLAPATLLRRELMLPGWHANLNGRKAAIDPGEGFFQQVVLPAGRADIRWRYVPPHAGLMAWLFALGMVGTVYMGVRGAREGRKNVLF